MGKILAICISEKKGTLKNQIEEAKFIEDFGPISKSDEYYW